MFATLEIKSATGSGGGGWGEVTSSLNQSLVSLICNFFDISTISVVRFFLISRRSFVPNCEFRWTEHIVDYCTTCTNCNWQQFCVLCVYFLFRYSITPTHLEERKNLALIFFSSSSFQKMPLNGNTGVFKARANQSTYFYVWLY